MFQQQNINTIFQKISIPTLEKGPKLNQIQTFLDQKDLATEQSLDRVTLKYNQSQQNYENQSPQQSSQFNIYSGQEGLSNVNHEDLQNIINSGYPSSDYFKQSIPLASNQNGINSQVLNLGQDCFVENIQRSLPLSVAQSAESSALIVPPSLNIPNHHPRQISPFNQNQQNIIQRQTLTPSKKPNFQINYNQAAQPQQQACVMYGENRPNLISQNAFNLTQDKQNMISSFGLPPINYNGQLQQLQQIKGVEGLQNADGLVAKQPNDNQRQTSPSQHFHPQMQQQPAYNQWQHNNEKVIINLPFSGQSYSPVSIRNKSAVNTTNTNVTFNNNQNNLIPSPYNNNNNFNNKIDNTSSPISKTSINANNNPQHLNQINNLNSNKVYPNNPTINNNQINRFQVFSLANAQDKISEKQLQQPYTITFGSSNNLNTLQSGNNNSSTLYQLLHPYQISNQSYQQNELQNASKGSLFIDPSQNIDQCKIISVSQPNVQNLNMDFNSILSTNNQLSQFPQLVTPPNHINQNPPAVIHNHPLPNLQQLKQQQNGSNQYQFQQQQQYSFYPISMQRKGSQSQYVSPKDSNSTALTSPIDMYGRQNNKLSQHQQGDSNHTTMRRCEISSNFNNPVLIPSENVSSREENTSYSVPSYQLQNFQSQKHQKNVSQNNSNQEIPQESSSVLQYQTNSQTLQIATSIVPSNGSLQIVQSPQAIQSSTTVQVKGDELNQKIPLLFSSNQNNLQESNQNLSSGSNQQFYYYKSNADKKKQRKANQSYDMAANYYQRIRQFNESSKEEKIEICLGGTHKQCMSNSRRNSLNRTDKSLDTSNVHDSNYNSSKIMTNTQIVSSTSLKPLNNQRNNKKRNEEKMSGLQQDKLKSLQPSSSEIQSSQDKSNKQIEDQQSNEEKLLSLLSPSYRKVKELQKASEEKYQADKVDTAEEQQSSGIFTFNNQRPSYPKFLQRVNSVKEIKKSSPQKQINTLLQNSNNNSGQFNEQDQIQGSSSPKIQQSEHEINTQQELKDQDQIVSQSLQSPLQRPIIDAAFQVNPYFVAEKYLNKNVSQNQQQYESLQLNQMQQLMESQQDLQNIQQSSTKHKINNLDITITATNSKKNRYLSNQASSQPSDRFNTNENDPNSNCSFKPDQFQPSPFNNNMTEQDVLVLSQLNSRNSMNTQQLNQSKRQGKQVSTIYIDMSQITSFNQKPSQFNQNNIQRGSQTTTNSSYQNKNNLDQQTYFQDDLLYENKENIARNIKELKSNQQQITKEQIFQQQQSYEKLNYETPQNDLKQYAQSFTPNQFQNNSSSTSNQLYQSPDKNNADANQIIIFDTQFQTQEDQKSVQNLNQKNFSTLQGMNMVTLESQAGGYENVQRFQYSPQTLQTEQGNYNTNNNQDEKNNDHQPNNEDINYEEEYLDQTNHIQEEVSPDHSYYYYQSDSPQILNKQIRPTIVPQLNLQKSFQYTLTTLNQNTSFNISQSPSSYSNAQQNIKNQMSQLINTNQAKQNQNYQQNYNNGKDENKDYQQNSQDSKNKANYKRHASLSNINQFQINNLQEINKQTTPINKQYYLSNQYTQPNSLVNSALQQIQSNQKKFNRTSSNGSNQNGIVKRNKSLGNITYQSEEMGLEMHLTKKAKHELVNHLQQLENRIKLLQREEEVIKKRAHSTKKLTENIKKVHQQVQEERQNQHIKMKTQEKKYIETQKDRVQSIKKDHEQKIKKVMSKNQREKQEMARSIKFNSHINKSVAEDNKQNYQIKTSEKKNQIKHKQMKFQEQKHLQQLYNQTSQMQQFLLKIKEEKVKKEEIEQKIQDLESVEIQLVQKLNQTYESNKQFLKNSIYQPQLSMHQSNIIDQHQQQQQQQQQKKENLLTTTENVNTNTSFTVFNQY